MRSLLLGAAAAVALSATPAMADVFVFGFIEKDKYVDVDVDIDIRKVININARVLLRGEKAAEATSLVNQTNTANHACENCAEKDDDLIRSANDNNGVVSVNQATGNMNNQGNAVSIAVSGTADDGNPNTIGAIAHAQSVVEQRNGFYIKLLGGFDDNDPNGDDGFNVFDLENVVEFLEAIILGPGHGAVGIGNTVNSINIVFRNARIEDSINGNSGGVHVNQAAGNINNQANVFTAAIGQDSGVALSDADLAQSNWRNTVNERAVVKTATITGSITGNSGVVGVNQTSGNMANQANVFTLGAATADLLN